MAGSGLSDSAALLAHVEAIGFDLSSATTDDERLLDATERARAARFHYDLHRRRYIAAHARVRRLLGERLNLDPAQVPITRTPLGKPILAIPSSSAAAADDAAPEPALHFNLSHCDDIGWLALANVPVGIDVERLRDLEELLPLIQSHCTADEIDSLIPLPAGQRVAAFLRIWTRKEAVLKAWGTGIGEIELHTLHVGLSGERIAPARDPERFQPLRITTHATDTMVVSIAALTGQPPEISLRSLD